ncbi:UBN2 domain-containing protein [Tanacetum coccineum]
MKTMMTEEFFPPKEIQMMESELWNLKVKDYDIIAYTAHFNELVLLCLEMVLTEKKKIEAYIRGLSDNIKGEVTSSSPTTLNAVVRMAHTLMEQKFLTKAKRDDEGKKRNWESFQSGSRANERPPMLEKGNYIPWESRFRRFLDNKLEDGERMWNSIQNSPYQRPMVVDPTNPTVPILEPLSKMTEGNKKQYIADVRVMNYLLQAIPNNIYNLVDACKNAKEMLERIKRLMHRSKITTHVRHSRLMDGFDKFAA